MKTVPVKSKTVVHMAHALYSKSSEVILQHCLRKKKVIYYKSFLDMFKFKVHKQIILVNQIFLLNQMIHSQIKLILFSGLTHLLKLTSNDSFKVFLRFQALQSSSPYSLLWKEQPAHYLKCLFCAFSTEGTNSQYWDKTRVN